jgi:hypothetical protein
MAMKNWVSQALLQQRHSLRLQRGEPRALLLLQLLRLSFGRRGRFEALERRRRRGGQQSWTMPWRALRL